MPRLSEIIRRRSEPRTKDSWWPWGRLIDPVALWPSDAGWLIAIAGVIALAVLVVLLAIPLLIFAAQAVWVFVLVLCGVFVRVLFGRPWTVEAATDGEARTWKIFGFRNSGRALVAVDLQLRTYGHPFADLPPDVTGRS